MVGTIRSRLVSLSVSPPIVMSVVSWVNVPGAKSRMCGLKIFHCTEFLVTFALGIPFDLLNSAVSVLFLFPGSFLAFGDLSISQIR